MRGMAEQRWWRSRRPRWLQAAVPAGIAQGLPWGREIDVCLVQAFYHSQLNLVLYTRGHWRKQTWERAAFSYFIVTVHMHTHLHTCVHAHTHSHHRARVERRFLWFTWSLNYIFFLTSAYGFCIFLLGGIWSPLRDYLGRYSRLLGGFPANGQIPSPPNDGRASGEHRGPLFSVLKETNCYLFPLKKLLIRWVQYHE